MKRIWDLDDAALLALSDEQVARFVDIECADKGVPLEPDYPGQRPTVDNPEADLTLYKVSGVDYHLADKDVADALAASLSSAKRFDTKKQGEVTVVKDLPSYVDAGGTVSTLQVVSAAAYDHHHTLIEENAAKLKTWETANREYESVTRQRNEASTGVYDAINEARERHSTEQRLEKAFADYTDLADGDKDVALRFLHNAYEEAADYPQFSIAEPVDESDGAA